ncbi:MAG: SelT/SelW/SelH family protein [Proteobacteria bacterium]|nr:SelT/SelW/SelH family protein [Pseudomonadota bacterium]
MKKFGAAVTLKRGSGGVFEISADGKVLFSKKKAGRFPEDDELLKLL